MNKCEQPDIDLCAACGEHAEFVCCEAAQEGLKCESDCRGDIVSNCCGAGSYNTDYETDYDR